MGPRASLDRCEKPRTHRDFLCILLYSVLHPHLVFCLDVLHFTFCLQHTSHKQPCPAAIRTREWTQTYALDRTATSIDPRTSPQTSSLLPTLSRPTGVSKPGINECIQTNTQAVQNDWYRFVPGANPGPPNSLSYL